ncbi:hypothetical protein [Nocardioides sp.]|uniref:hypothetical protein n=1 Tax=Nocardioides sp. TaxID=35761 RepID=UPI003D0E6248
MILIPVTLVLEWVSYAEERQATGVNWVSHFEVVNGVGVIFFIVAAAICAGYSRRWVELRVQTRATSRDLWTPVMPIAMVAGTMILTHLGWVAVLSVIHLGDTVGPFRVGPTVPTVLGMAAGSALGFSAVTWLPSRLTGPALGCALYFALLQLLSGPFTNLVSLAGIDSPLLGVRARPVILAGQTGFFTLLAVACLVGARPARPHSRAGGYLAAGSATFVVTLAALFVSGMGPARFERDPAVDLVCAQHSETRICALPESQAAAQEMLGSLTKADERWRSATGAVPRPYEQRLDVPDPTETSSGPQLIRVAASMTEQDVVYQVLYGTHPCSLTWPSAQLDSLDAAMENLVGDGLDAPWPHQDELRVARWARDNTC